MTLSVIGPGAAGDRGYDLLFTFGYRQVTQLLCDLVVSFLGTAVPVDLPCVLAGSGVGLGSGDLEVCGLAFHQSRQAACCCQRRSVIDLGCALCTYGQLCRCDGQGAFQLVDVQFSGDVLACGIADHQLICRGTDRLSGHVLHDCCGGCLLQFISLRKSTDGYRRSVLLTIIGPASAGGDHADLISVLPDGEGSLSGLDGVVTSLGRSLGSPVDGPGVGTGSNVGLGSCGAEWCGFSIDESCDGSFCFKFFTVIDTFCIRSLYYELCRQDPDPSVLSGDVQFACDVLTFCIADDEVIGLGRYVFCGHIHRSLGGFRLLQGVSFRKRADGHRCSVGFSVIGPGSAICSGHDLIGVLRYRQSSQLLGDSVVAPLGTRILPLDLQGVLAGSNLGLRSRGLIRRGLSCCESCYGSLCSERSSVIDGRCVRCDDGQFRRQDPDLSVCSADVQLVCHILALCVDDHQVICSGLDGCLCDIGGCSIRGCLLHLVSPRDAGDGNTSPVLLAIVGPGSSRGGHHDLICGLAHHQGADGLGYQLVISGLSCAAPVDVISVGAFSHGGLASGEDQSCGLIAHQSLQAAFRCQRCAVVDFGCAVGLYGDLGRGDLQSVADILDVQC